VGKVAPENDDEEDKEAGSVEYDESLELPEWTIK